VLDLEETRHHEISPECSDFNFVFFVYYKQCKECLNCIRRQYCSVSQGRVEFLAKEYRTRHEFQDKCDPALISETKCITIKVFRSHKIGIRQVAILGIPKHWSFDVNKKLCDE
jgi:hypothetical protein